MKYGIAVWLELTLVRADSDSGQWARARTAQVLGCIPLSEASGGSLNPKAKRAALMESRRSAKLSRFRVAAVVTALLLGSAGLRLAHVAPSVRSLASGTWQDGSSIWLWHSLRISIPSGIRVTAIDYRVQPTVYLFSAYDGRAVMMGYRGQAADSNRGTMFTRRELATAVPMVISGLAAWRRMSGDAEQVSVRLPKPRGCAETTYVRFVFDRDNVKAEAMVGSIRPEVAARCFDFVY